MEWVFFAGGAVTLIAIKLFISWLGLLMKLELQRREIKQLKMVIKMHEARNGKLETLWLNAEDRADAADGAWPEVIG